MTSSVAMLSKNVFEREIQHIESRVRFLNQQPYDDETDILRCVIHYGVDYAHEATCLFHISELKLNATKEEIKRSIVKK